MRIRISGVTGNVSMPSSYFHHRVCSAPIRPPICSLCCSGSSPAPCSSSIFCFVMAIPKAEARAAAARATATEGDGEEDEPPEEPPKPAKKQKGGVQARELLWLLWHLRHLPRHLHVRQLPMRPPPRAHPSTCTCRDRDTVLECIPMYMYTICIANVNPVCDVSEG